MRSAPLWIIIVVLVATAALVVYKESGPLVRRTSSPQPAARTMESPRAAAETFASVLCGKDSLSSTPPSVLLGGEGRFEVRLPVGTQEAAFELDPETQEFRPLNPAARDLLDDRIRCR